LGACHWGGRAVGGAWVAAFGVCSLSALPFSLAGKSLDAG